MGAARGNRALGPGPGERGEGDPGLGGVSGVPGWQPPSQYWLLGAEIRRPDEGCQVVPGGMLGFNGRQALGFIVVSVKDETG